MRALRRLADPRDPRSLGVLLRRRRFAFFESLLTPLPRPLTILDVGGTENFWARMDFVDPGVEIHLINLGETPAPRHPRIRSLTGDARDLGRFTDDEYDVVFSNSVIEHVGTFEDQEKMAREIVRVGKRFFVQTPNRYFPIEPHFIFPFFQFLPRRAQVALVMNLSIGWANRSPTREAALARVSSVELLTRSQLQRLFPGARLYRERVLGLTKSLTVYGGW